MKSLKLLFLSTPIGPLGSGTGGGVELTLQTLSREMARRGHHVQVVAPLGSQLSSSADTMAGTISIVTVAGDSPSPAQHQARTADICLPANSVLAGMWDYAQCHQSEYDLIVNFAYDWLPLYLTPFFSTPVAHFISMGSCSIAMDEMVAKVTAASPQKIGFYTQAQAATFALPTPARCLGSAIDLSLYQFCEQPDPYLIFLGRIAPEKGLEDAVSAAQITHTPLKILGKMENEAYWQQVCQAYPEAPVEYLDFLPTEKMQQVLRKSRALLMSHKWVEAFGNVVIEALACGVPVIAYRRGGPSEIVRHGKTGWLVEPDSVSGLCEAIEHIDEIDRHACRQQAEDQYSLSAWGDRFSEWFETVLRCEDR